jgi:type III pantothenate kinase
MVVAVDIGNSALKVAPVVAGSVGRVRRLEAGSPVAGLLGLLRDAVAEHAESLAGREDASAERAVCAVSVVPAWAEALADAVATLGLPLRIVTPADVPLPSRVTEPERIGPDRLLAAWAARELHGAPVIAVGLGTATTVDAVDASGAHRGGAILPGLRLAAESLASGTAGLPLVEPAPPPVALGVDTRGAMQSGIVLGHVGAIRELVARMALELGSAVRPRVVAFGGFASADWSRGALLAPAGPGLPPVADVLDPHLVLRGLGLLGRA